jgi:PAS domain S-box-containing protein
LRIHLINIVFYSSIYDSSNNVILLGSYNRGLIIYDLENSTFKSLTKKDGLNDNAILFLRFDKDQSNLWFGTSQGLNKLNYQYYISTGEIKLNSYNNYDGFPGKECNQTKPIFDKKNQLWFSTVQGIVKYNLANEKGPSHLSQPFISSVEINYQKIDLSNYGEKNAVDSTIIDDIVFPYNMNNLTVSFSSLYYSNPLNIKFKYMLHGIDEYFSPFTSNDYVTYSSLSPGSYQFELISFTHDGMVPSIPITFSFTIETPFWKSNYFIALNIFLLLFLLYIIYRVRTTAIRKKNIQLLKLYKENISYQKQIIESEKDYKGLFENAHNPIIIIDPETLLIVDVNYSAELLYGYKRDELLKLSLKVLSVEVEDTIHLIQTVIKDQDVKSYITAHRKKDGSEIILNVNASVANYKGKIAIVSLHRDITEEEEIKKQLLYTKETAEKSDKLKGEFLSLISHEIRTPINTILGYIAIISEEIDTISPEEVNSLIEPVKRSSSRIMRTIELILDMSAINAGTNELEFKDNNVAKFLFEIITEQRDLNKNINLNIEFLNKSKNEILYVDEYTFIQIFSNLIDNAIKYTLEGDIQVTLFNDKSKTIIEIKDTGIGINKDFLPTLFDSFTQEEHGYSRQYDGNGLGLALVKNYVKINKGIVSVASKKGIGTKFRVEFNT